MSRMEMMFWRSDVRFGLGGHDGLAGRRGVRRAADNGRVRKVSANPPDVSTRANPVPSCRGRAQARASDHEGWTDIVESQAKEEKRGEAVSDGAGRRERRHSSGQKEI